MEEIKNKKEQNFDIKLIKRLMGYSRPFIGFIALSFILLLLSTAVDLIRPVLIGSTIDNFLNGYKKFYQITDGSDENRVTIFSHDLVLIDRESINDGSANKEIKYAGIYYFGQNYYLFLPISASDIDYLDNYNFNNDSQEDSLYLSFENRSVKGHLLNEEDLKLLRSSDFRGLYLFSLLFLVLLIMSFILNYSQTIILQITSQKIIYSIRKEIFAHIQRLSSKYFDNNPVGKLVTRITNDTETLNEMYTTVIVDLFKNVFLIIGIILMMLKINLELSLISFLVLPFIFFFTVLFRKIARSNYREIRNILSNFNSFLSENISGMKIIQIFNIEKKKMEQFSEHNSSLNKSYLKEIIIFGIFKPSMYVLFMVTTVLIILFGGKWVLEKRISFGTLFIFINYISLFFQPIQQLAEKFNILQSAMASSERIFNLLDEKIDIVNSKDAIRLKDIKGKIEFRNVWFAYKDEDWVLKDISFTIMPGETVAFVGATGAGKSSIINLICRYYDIQKGDIFIDDQNIKDIDLNSLRVNVGQVLQDVYLFSGNIKENIRLRDETISDYDVEDSAKFVNADNFIEELPDKYEHKVTERGATFSSGQRQLISFARAIASRPSILVLDEATSNIDTETELLIQDALYKMIKDKTSIIIAHRLSTIQHSDKIIVLHKGRLREEGTHQSLLSKKDIYYNLYQLQYT